MESVVDVIPPMDEGGRFSGGTLLAVGGGPPRALSAVPTEPRARAAHRSIHQRLLGGPGSYPPSSRALREVNRAGFENPVGELSGGPDEFGEPETGGEA
jgi:hypothetical protein